MLRDLMVVRFPEPDSAYLIVASLRKRLDAVAVAGIYVVPSDEGPALECNAEIWEHDFVQELVTMFDGTPVEGP